MALGGLAAGAAQVAAAQYEGQRREGMHMAPAFHQAGGPADYTPADYTLEIAETDWEIAPGRHIRTAAYGARIPGQLLRLREGQPVTIDIVNRLTHEEIVHWHGLWVPVDVDGAMEEGSPMIAAGGRTRIAYTPRPTGLHWYHTHAMAAHNLNHGLYTGQSGPLLVEPRSQPGRYDSEHILMLHDWDPYPMAGDDGSQMIRYSAATINGRMLGAGEPLRVRKGERALMHIVNASATDVHWLALDGHLFEVVALDGTAVPTPAAVRVLRLGPAERVTAVVRMTTPGVWVLGEPRESYRKAGMGIVVEYANCDGKPEGVSPVPLRWDYRAFADASPLGGAMSRPAVPEHTIPLVFTSRFRGHGATDQWRINGRSWPDTESPLLAAGARYRLVFDNRSTDDHPVHLHRHQFELVSIAGQPTRGLRKDVVVVEAGTRVEADLLADNPGNTLFHCHQQDHMDAGFMMLFRYEGV